MTSALMTVRRRGFIKGAIAMGTGVLAVAGVARAQQAGGLPRNAAITDLFSKHVDLMTPAAKKLTKANLLQMQEIQKNTNLNTGQVVEQFNKENGTAFTVE